MRSRLFVTLARVATRQLQNPAMQKALASLASAAVDRFTIVSIERLKRFERRLRSYDEVVECEWWEVPKDKPGEIVE